MPSKHNPKSVQQLKLEKEYLTAEQLPLLRSLADKANSERTDVFRIRNWMDFEDGFKELVQERAMELFAATSTDRPKAEKRLFQACAAVVWIREEMSRR